MTLRRVVIVAGLIGLMAIFIVYERSRIVRAGYRISELSRDETSLVEQVRIRNVEVTQLRQPEFIARQVERLRIGLVRPPRAELVSFARTGAEFVD